MVYKFELKNCILSINHRMKITRSVKIRKKPCSSDGIRIVFHNFLIEKVNLDSKNGENPFLFM